mgnify:CR=1 FL=1
MHVQAVERLEHLGLMHVACERGWIPRDHRQRSRNLRILQHLLQLHISRGSRGGLHEMHVFFLLLRAREIGTFAREPEGRD